MDTQRRWVRSRPHCGNFRATCATGTYGGSLDPILQTSSASNAHWQYMIINLGMSKNFGVVDFEHLTFPNHLRVDYVRVYQPVNAVNVGCNPKGFPTTNYIIQ